MRSSSPVIPSWVASTARAFRAVDPRGPYRLKLATIVLLANAKEHGFVDSPGQSGLDAAHWRNR